MTTPLTIPSIPCPFDLTDFVESCRDALIIANPTQFHYPAELSGVHASTELWTKDAGLIKKLNEELLTGLRNRANLYAIYIRNNGDTDWDPVYVGHSASTEMRARLTAHLITKSAETGAVVEKVAKAVRNGAEIAVSFLLVTPEALRLVAEDEILRKNEATNELQWNKNGRKR